MTTHWTKGPWRWDKRLSDGGAPMIVAHDNRSAAHAAFRAERGIPPRERPIAKVLFHVGSEDPEVHANARLIEACPELYEALHSLVLGIRSIKQSSKPPTYLLEGSLEMADRALAKARGEKT